VNGLSEYGWPTCVDDEDTLVELALNGNPGASFARRDMYDATCG
jgi:hypothetical protein